MKTRFIHRGGRATVAVLAATVASRILCAQTAGAADQPPPSSYIPVVSKETFEQTQQRMTAEKAAIMQRQKDLLAQRYDLSDRPSDAKMGRQKPLQEGVRAKLSGNVTWDELSGMTPEQIQEK